MAERNLLPPKPGLLDPAQGYAARPRARGLLEQSQDAIDGFMSHQPAQGMPTMGDVTRLGITASPFVGDALALEDAKRELSQGNYGRAAFNAATALPMIGDAMTALKISAPAISGLGLTLRQMARRTGDAPVTPFSRMQGIVGGPQAKTWNQEIADFAKEMDASGMSREEIWRATGEMGHPMFKGVDGKWRFEIDDSAYKYTPENLPLKEIQGTKYKVGTAGDSFTHDKLFDAYPEARNVESVDYNFGNPRGARGEYRQSTSMDPHGSITVWDAAGRDQTIPLHEMNHKIQGVEGFARGGSKTTFGPNELPPNPAYAEYQKNIDLHDQLNTILKSNEYQRQLNESNSIFSKEYLPKIEEYEGVLRDRSISSKERRMAQQEINRLFDEFDKMSKQKFGLMGKIDELSAQGARQTAPNPTLDPEEAYRALAGEAEARAVQRRMNLTPDQRVARPFWEDFDVPESEQIVITR